MHNDDIDFQDYKGLFYNAQTDKYIDSATGAHFKYTDLCDKLNIIAENRKDPYSFTEPHPVKPPPKSKLHHVNLLKIKIIKNINKRKPLIFTPKFNKPFIRVKSPDFSIPHIKSPTNISIKLKDVPKGIKKTFPLKIQNINSDTFFKSLDMRHNEPLSILKNYKDNTLSSKALFQKFNKSISRNKESIDLLLEHFSNPPTSTFRRTLQRKSFVHL